MALNVPEHCEVFSSPAHGANNETTLKLLVTACAQFNATVSARPSDVNALLGWGTSLAYRALITPFSSAATDRLFRNASDRCTTAYRIAAMQRRRRRRRRDEGGDRRGNKSGAGDGDGGNDAGGGDGVSGHGGHGDGGDGDDGEGGEGGGDDPLLATVKTIWGCLSAAEAVHRAKCDIESPKGIDGEKGAEHARRAGQANRDEAREAAARACALLHPLMAQMAQANDDDDKVQVGSHGFPYLSSTSFASSAAAPAPAPAAATGLERTLTATPLADGVWWLASSLHVLGLLSRTSDERLRFLNAAEEAIRRVSSAAQTTTHAHQTST